jgi:predicted O-linked N-acetylglucosamine transferase (SPINDLY family)
MSPAQFQSLLQTALKQHQAGRLADAELSYRRLRASAPRDFDVQHLSGLLAYQQGRMADAAELFARAHKLNPKSVVCEMRLGMALLSTGRIPEAEQHLRHTVELDPNSGEAWDSLAYFFKTQDRLAEAISCHENAVAKQPGNPTAWCNFGLTLSLFGRYADALNCHDRALAADPKFALARFGRAQALHQSNRIPEAATEYRAFLAVEPRHTDARSYLLFALHSLPGISREELFAEHVSYGRTVGAAPAVNFPNSPVPERKLRVAVLSPDLRIHSCAYFLEPLLQHLDREQFELYLYHDHFRTDAVSDRFKALATVWRNFVGQPGSVVEKSIREDAADILIDLAGHTGMTNRLPLFARRLAPVQITYLGYPNTTGVPAMDCRFTDAIADPEGDADRFATEKLVRFAPTAWCYAPPVESPPVERRPDEAVTFGCFNTPSKLTDEMLALWARLLEEVPGSRLLLKGAGLTTEEARARYTQRFAMLGLPMTRVELLDRTPDNFSHLALYGRVDVALDTYPYHGTTTTCEALWMGVPVVTLVGDRHMSRVGLSLLTSVGHAEWAATSPDDYVRIAKQLAIDPAQRAALRTQLREDLRRSSLLDHAGQSARFAAALRQCWTGWCERTAPVA